MIAGLVYCGLEFRFQVDRPDRLWPLKSVRVCSDPALMAPP